MSKLPQKSDDSAYPWKIVCILPDARQRTVAGFYNRRDAEDHLRVLQRFLPASVFKIVFEQADAPT
ncbi:MAG: hypothetical protein WA828_14800 [Coleofasciculaceae cyanobacterium]